MTTRPQSSPPGPGPFRSPEKIPRPVTIRIFAVVIAGAMIPGCVGMNTINNRSHRLGKIVEEVLLVPAPKGMRMDVQLINKVSALPVADRTDIALCMADIFWHAKASAITHPDSFAEYCALLLSVPFCHQAEIERL